MKNLEITEGYMPFKGYQTYYRIVGDIAQSYEKGLAPLLLLHGGPGSSHNYFEVLDPIAQTGRAVISYDQLGCGKSNVEGHKELWNKETWLEELVQLREYLGLKYVHLLGQSWGGQLAITYMCDKVPYGDGVQSLILSSTLSSSQLWGREQHRQIKFMSEEDQEAIRIAEETGDYTAKAYLVALDHFTERHTCGKYGEDAPECLRRKKIGGIDSYETAWGPNEFTPQGNLKDWDYTDKLDRIKVPTLIISGTNDLCTPLIAKTMYDRIPNSHWELFDGCRHMCFAEKTDEYINLLNDWFSHI